jgi:hypothetical protein
VCQQIRMKSGPGILAGADAAFCYDCSRNIAQMYLPNRHSNCCLTDMIASTLVLRHEREREADNYGQLMYAGLTSVCGL